MTKAELKRLLSDFFDEKSCALGEHSDALENSRFVAKAIPPYTGGWLIFDQKECRYLDKKDITLVGRERLLTERLENH